jgi:hypothetical protein
MNQVESWDGLKNAVQWIILHYIGNTLPLERRGLLDVWQTLMSVWDDACPGKVGGTSASEDKPITCSANIEDNPLQKLERVSLQSSDSNPVDVPDLEPATTVGFIPNESITGFANVVYAEQGPDITSLRFNGINKLVGVKSAPYLTGLWTLQEACLCPTMRLLNKNLEPLLMGSCR